MFFIWDRYCSEKPLTEESQADLWAVHSNFPKLMIKMNCAPGTPSHQHSKRCLVGSLWVMGHPHNSQGAPGRYQDFTSLSKELIKAGKEQICDVYSFVCYSGGGTEGIRGFWSVLFINCIFSPSAEHDGPEPATWDGRWRANMGCGTDRCGKQSREEEIAMRLSWLFSLWCPAWSQK